MSIRFPSVDPAPRPDEHTDLRCFFLLSPRMKNAKKLSFSYRTNADFPFSVPSANEPPICLALLFPNPTVPPLPNIDYFLPESG